MEIRRGDIYWVQLQASDESASPIPHPYVIVQVSAPDHDNRGRVTACAVTSNIKRVSMPGNVLIEAGEANLPRRSVVEVAKVVSLDQAQLGEYIGSLGERRMTQLLAGMQFVRQFFRGT